MSASQKNKFELGEMVLGFFVGLFLDGIAFIIDIFSAGAGGLFIQGTVWPFIKKFWISSKNKGGEKLLQDYLVPIAVQALPLLPTMCATIPLYMYFENKMNKSVIINREQPQTMKKEVVVETIEKIERAEDSQVENNEPKIISVPSSPLRTRNNPVIQKYEERNNKKAA